MNEYLVPSIASHDLSKLHLFQNQATCNSLLEGQNLAVNTDAGVCGFATEVDSATFCLSGPPLPLDQLVGLVLVGEGEQIQISNCVVDPDPGCPGTQYDCTSAVPGFTTEQCILRIECDGQEIASCSVQSCEN